ncbi:hypothetical protein QR680_009379 [Steinernema hermaphroditum]|uniref:Large subunit GTPase 1 homolog n=1 Tax=Steinernema hermaphroditum TaxID=289476 RepID=A0AA39M8R3_9BILA|nr:hypothetical protein QR680_009379 [Steinernema hermaphroditum]
MTKRRPSNKKPTGVNKSLGNSLSNDRERTRTAHRRAKYDAEDLENPAFMNQDEPKEKNVDSITDQSNLDDFLARAELAGTDFTAEKCNFHILPTINEVHVVPTREDISNNVQLQKKHAHKLKIPRRPPQHMWESAEELIRLENENFLEWRRSLADLQEVDGLELTPFERNLELWRQLWRVVERSDIVVQIVDARNPMLFYSEDLSSYVAEAGLGKQNVLLLNKSDLLSQEQIELWRGHFQRHNITAVFWSALSEDQEEEDDRNDSAPYIQSTGKLVDYFKMLGHVSDQCVSRPVVVGMVGYPNVGKSSTINRIVGEKKVSVSATPGKTRHLQTLIIDPQVTLCDCPGLVMPSFALNRCEMLLNGILPADQMRDHFGPIDLLSMRVKRSAFEKVYSVTLPKPANHEDPDKPPSAHEVLTSIAFMRGFMSANGVPDCSRAARMIIKDVVNGKLNWASAPPDYDQDEYDKLSCAHYRIIGTQKGQSSLAQLEKRHLLEGDNVKSNSLDKGFFSLGRSGIHVKQVFPTVPDIDSKKHRKGKKMKLRNVYGHLDY